jgi:predicted site-specific integrase-resolvase
MPIDISEVKADTLYLVVDVAKILDVREATIRAYLNEGSLKGTKNKKRKWRVYGRDVVNFVNGK